MTTATRRKPGSGPLNRYICTEAAPWAPGKGQWSKHPDATQVDPLVHVGDGVMGATFLCPHCGVRIARRGT